MHEFGSISCDCMDNAVTICGSKTMQVRNSYYIHRSSFPYHPP